LDTIAECWEKALDQTDVLGGFVFCTNERIQTPAREVSR
jgi:hypothetical protein